MSAASRSLYGVFERWVDSLRSLWIAGERRTRLWQNPSRLEKNQYRAMDWGERQSGARLMLLRTSDVNKDGRHVSQVPTHTLLAVNHVSAPFYICTWLKPNLTENLNSWMWLVEVPLWDFIIHVWRSCYHDQTFFLENTSWKNELHLWTIRF